MTCDVGDLVKLTARFTDPGTGDPVEPSEVVCTVLSPSGTETATTVGVQDGIYATTVEATEPGEWRYAWDGKGSHQASGEGMFWVKQQTVPRPKA